MKLNRLIFLATFSKYSILFAVINLKIGGFPRIRTSRDPTRLINAAVLQTADRKEIHILVLIIVTLDLVDTRWELTLQRFLCQLLWQAPYDSNAARSDLESRLVAKTDAYLTRQTNIVWHPVEDSNLSKSA